MSDQAAAEHRVWEDFEYEVVTDPEAEAERVRAFNEQLERDAAQEE